jgi:hypothetical protein
MTPSPLVIGYGDPLPVPGEHIGGALSVVQMRLTPRSVGAAFHVTTATRSTSVREGVMTFDLGDGSRDVGPDGVVSVARGRAARLPQRHTVSA